jgi:hypothetical protein
MTTTTSTNNITITEPCIIDDLPEDIYHSDPVSGGSLSSGGARELLKPGGPAKFAHYRGKQRNSTTFDLGKAVHTEILGAGAGIVEVDARDWRTKAAQQARTEAYSAGLIPILAEDYWRVRQIASAVRSHPLAGPLLAAVGPAEQSYFWVDAETGVWRRARTDKVIHDRGGRAIIVDLKTCEAADARAAARSAATYGYHQQDPWYRDALAALGVDDDPGFLFVFVEKEPPHLVHVVQLSPDDVAAGRARNRRALELYAACLAGGHWPGHPEGITQIELPTWAREDI